MDKQISSIKLWHITPIDLGVDFYNPTISNIEVDDTFYELVNDPYVQIDRNNFAKDDYESAVQMKAFLSAVRKEITFSDDPLVNRIQAVAKYPHVTDCISKFVLSDNLNCYIMINGTAVFYDSGKPIPVDEINYFSTPVFYERQIVEDDFCANPEVSEGKRQIYLFMNILWKHLRGKVRAFSGSSAFRNNGISYTLCITVIDIPDFLATKVHPVLKRNVFALLDTSAFNNVLNKSQWESIKTRIDNDDMSGFSLMELSENLSFADNWSGVVIVGDIEKNATCLNWFLEFEIYLQSLWLLFDAYSEDIRREEHSSIELQTMLNVVEYYKLKLDNDISSNMEQSRHKMRRSLILSSDIGVIYSQMHGILSNRLKLNIMYEEKRKGKFTFLSDIALLVIAIMQVYGVINELLLKESFAKSDIITMCIVGGLTIICVWFMAKSR